MIPAANPYSAVAVDSKTKVTIAATVPPWHTHTQPKQHVKGLSRANGGHALQPYLRLLLSGAWPPFQIDSNSKRRLSVVQGHVLLSKHMVEHMGVDPLIEVTRSLGD